MSKHNDFIQTPIERILEEVPMALRNIEIGFDTFGLYEYVMQSVFLKMTGFQEQKMKCICWELATDDYNYRYTRYKREPLGECSILDEKNRVLNDLVNHVINAAPDFKTLSDNERQNIINETNIIINTLYEEGNLKGWAEKEFHIFKELFSNCSKECVGYMSKEGVMKEFLGHCENCSRKGKPEAKNAICEKGSLKDAYDMLIKHRNRCAHNTHSYQHNLPSLQSMYEDKFVFENYFLHFAILIIIDKITICLFRKYFEKSHAYFHL